jgi:tetratricopeptide (TPR) repeat protein
MRISKIVLPMSLLPLLSACGPEGSLSPLFEKKDVVFQDALLGTWISVEGEKGETYSFKKSRDDAYDLTFPLDEGKECKSEVHLVRLGEFLFLDASPAHLTKEEEALNKGPLQFPQVGLHIFGRIWIEGDVVRIALLDDEWVTNMDKENKLPVGYTSTDDDTILTASTEELQKFVLRYAEDPKAFSFEVGLCRQGKLEGNDCSVALLKQKLRINPNDAQTWNSLGQTYSEIGRDDEALAAFNKAAQIDPDDRDYHEQIGLALMKMSRYEQARKELHKMDEIAFSYFLEDRFPEAVSAFEKPPRRGTAQLFHTVIHNLALRHIGKQAEAQKLLQEHGWPIAETQWELLRLAYLQGLIAEERLISKAGTPEQKSEAYFFVGYEYLLKGDKQKARECFQKVLDAKIVNSGEYIIARARLAQWGPK